MQTYRRLGTAVAAFVILVLVSSAPAQAATRKVALGVSVLDDQSIAEVEAHKTAVGRYPAIWGVWSAWGGEDAAFPSAFMSQLKSRGIVPMVNWEPIAPGSSDCTKWSLDNILKGDYDAYIREWATAAKSHVGTVILRFAHEMNGYWFLWGHGRCQNTPAKFRATWKHVWNIFRGPGGVGATNVKFMFSPLGARYVPQYYPGPTYVNYLGLTAFNWGPPTHRWTTMAANFKPGMNALMALPGRKPIIAAEMGGAHAPSCSACNKVTYISNGYPAIFAKYPRVKAMVYFDIDMSTITSQPNWRLDSPPAALNAYKQIVANPKFQGVIR